MKLLSKYLLLMLILILSGGSHTQAHTYQIGSNLSDHFSESSIEKKTDRFKATVVDEDDEQVSVKKRLDISSPFITSINTWSPCSSERSFNERLLAPEALFYFTPHRYIMYRTFRI